MKRRTFLSRTGGAIVTLPWLPGCGGGGGGPSDSSQPAVDLTTTHVGSITVDAAAAGAAVNRRILGSNVEWVDRGDNLLNAAGAFDANLLGLVKAMAPTVLRYPGGTQSDAFHWNQPSNQHVFTGSVQPTLMNTQRLLELCESTAAEPLFTVNVISGTADEAAAWVRATNVTRLTSSATGKLLPKVTFWEIGNEPYLQAEVAPGLNLNIAPAEFARRANLFIAAMRAVDPAISIGLPLTLDTRNGVPITAYPGFARSVLAALTQRFDFVALHNAYLPLVFGGAVNVAALTPGTMAGAESVRDDLAATRAMLAALRPGETYPLAVTEHAPLFSLGEGATDRWNNTPLGAMYLADLIRVFAETGDLLLANHWSLSGNDIFGAIGGATGAGFNRPVADVLTLAGTALRGNRLVPTIVCDSIATPSVGLVAPRSALPLMSALVTREVTREGSTLRALLIHKDATRNAQFSFRLSGAAASTARMTTLSASDVTLTTDVAGLWQRAASTPAGSTSLVLTLPPHSVALLELML